MIPALIAYLGVVLAMSLVCFATYGWDKRRAFNGSQRISENTLQMLAFSGGWPGAFYAQRHFRHKTKKVSFLIVFWALVVLHIAIVATVAHFVW